MQHTTNLSADATVLIDLGLRVFPTHLVNALGACSCWRGAACSKAGKHPVLKGWQAHATSNPDAARAVWAKARAMTKGAEPNIAVATGRGSGVVVLHVDEGGEKTLAALEQELGSLPATPVVHTGGGGRHLYFAHPGGDVPNSVRTLGEGLDVRGDGGYVVAPGSIHRTGREYAWSADGHPEVVPLPELPDSWLAKIRDTKTKAAADSASGRPRRTANTAGQPIMAGSRNMTLAVLGGAMRRAGCSAGIGPALAAENAERCVPPLCGDEVADIARSSEGWLPSWFSGPGFFADPELNASARHVLRVLADHTNHQGECWPGVPLLASHTGLSQRTVKSALAALVEARRITRTSRRGVALGCAA